MAKKPINWGMWTAIGTGVWFLWDVMQKKKEAETQSQQTAIQANQGSVLPSIPTQLSTGPNATGDLTDLINTKTPGIMNAGGTSPVSLPNVEGMTSQAVRALASQMGALGMGQVATQLRTFADNMDAQGIQTAPKQTV